MKVDNVIDPIERQKKIEELTLHDDPQQRLYGRFLATDIPVLALNWVNDEHKRGVTPNAILSVFLSNFASAVISVLAPYNLPPDKLKLAVEAINHHLSKAILESYGPAVQMHDEAQP